MNLTSKRVAAALITLAAFTGVLLKDIPFTTPEADSARDHLLSDSRLGDVAVMASAGETSESLNSFANAPEPTSKSPFVGEPVQRSTAPGAALLPDNPGERQGPKLPNPVGASASTPPSSRGVGPFMPLTTQAGGGGPTEPDGGGGGSGGAGGGSGGSGSLPGESTPPATGGEGSIPGGTPIINQPDAPSDNSPANGGTPDKPGSTTPDDDITNGRPSPSDVNIDLPTNDEGEPDPAVNPPWVDDTLDEPTDLPQTPDAPKFPTDEKTHNVPDHGSTIALLMAAFAALAAFRRQAKLC